MFAAMVVLAALSILARAEDEVPAGARADDGVGFTFSKKEQQRIAELAKDAKANDGMFTVRTERFVVQAPNSAQLAAQCAVFADLFQDAFFARLDVRPQVEVVPTLVVYPTSELFLKKCNNGERSAFLWLTKDKLWPEFHVYTALASPTLEHFSEVDVRPIQRGVARALLRRVVGRNEPPVWLDEGIASWFEGLDIRADFEASRTARIRRSPYLRQLRSMLDESSTPPELAALFALDLQTWNVDNFQATTQRREALAESFVDLLLATDVARAERKLVIDALKRGRPFKELHEKELNALQKKWRDHVREIAERLRVG